MKKSLMLLAFVSTVLVLATPQSDAQGFLRNRLTFVNPVQNPPATAPVPMPGESKKLGPVACAIVRNQVAKAIAKRDNIGIVAAHRKAREIDDETINSMVSAAETASKTKVDAIGDGTIIQAILDWLKSPQGQAFIDALIKIILDLLAHNKAHPSHWYAASGEYHYSLAA